MAFLLSAGEELLPLCRCCIGIVGGGGGGGYDDPCNVTDSLVVSPSSSSSSEDDEENDEDEENDTKVAAPFHNVIDTNTDLPTAASSTTSLKSPTMIATSNEALKKKKKEVHLASPSSTTTIPQDVVLLPLNNEQKSNQGNGGGGGGVVVPAVVNNSQDLLEAGFEKLFGLSAISTATATATARRGRRVSKKSNEKEEEEDKNLKVSTRLTIHHTENERSCCSEEDTTIVSSSSEESTTTPIAIAIANIRERRAPVPDQKAGVGGSPPLFPPGVLSNNEREDINNDENNDNGEKQESGKNSTWCKASESPLPLMPPRGENQKISDSQQQQQQQQSAPDLTTTTTTTTTTTDKTMIKKIFDVVCFEMKFVGLASSTLLLSCIAHYAIYELIYTIILETTEAFDGIYQFNHLNLLYGGLMVLGLTLLRITGYLWNFLTSKQYRQTKAEFKERRKMGKNSVGTFDVRIHDWFEDRDFIRITVEVIAFYVCYISLMFFWNKFLTACVDQRESILQQLPSAQYRLQQQTEENDNELVVEASSKSWDVKDFEFLYKTVAKTTYYQYSGSAEAPLFSAALGVMVYVCTLGLSMFLLSKTGVSFEDTW